MIANVSAHRRANAFAQALEEQSDQGTAAERRHEQTAPEQAPRAVPAPGQAPPPGQATAPGPVSGPAAGPASGQDRVSARAPGHASAPGRAPGHARDAGAARLLAVAAELGALPRPQLDPGVKAVQRAQLVAAMEAMLAEGTPDGPRVPDPRAESSPAHRSGSTAGADPGAGPSSGSRGRGAHAHRAGPLSKFRPRSRLGKGLAAGGLSIGVAAASFGGVAAASSDALPGDSLYGLKRGIEDFRLDFADGSDERGRAYLDQASTRLNEARRLMERGRGGQLDHESLGEIRGALSRMTEDASEGHRLLHEAYQSDPDSLGPIQALSTFSRSHRDTWGKLRRQLPVQLGDVSEQVTSVFDAIDQEVEPLQALLPESPEYSGGNSQQQGPDTDGTADSTGPSSSASPSAGDSGTSSGDDRSTAKPQTSASATDGGGLLGGGTGGLFDPPEDESTASTPPSEGKSPTSEPQITLPPLLPGLLPGLGLGGDTEE